MGMITRFLRGWTPWVGLSLALIGALSYFLLSTLLVIGMALAAGDPRRVGLTLVLAGLLLSAIGLGLGFRLSIDRRRRMRTAILFLVTLGLAGIFLTGAYLTFPYEVKAVRFQNGDVQLAGTLILPKGEGPHPAVVFMHGSGPEPGALSFHWADRFARQGVAALVYDKRGSGASRGGHPRDSYVDLAEDAVAGVRFLQGRPELDPQQIGLWGFSEGGWTAPLAASLSEDVAFLMVVSGGGASVEAESYYSIEHNLRGRGFGEAEVAQAVALRRRVNDYYRNGEGREGVLEAVRQAQGQPWYVEAGLLPKGSEDVCLSASSCAVEYLAFIEFDSTPLLEGLEIPMLFIYGEEDRSHPVMESVQILEKRLVDPGGKDVTILAFPEADHSMLVWAGPISRLAPGFVDTLTGWLLERVQVASSPGDRERPPG